jgi:uncharacterized protein
MDNQFDGVTPMIHHSRISVPYHWWAGDTASEFLVGLRDRQIIQGTCCPQCRKVYVPPRKTCPVCFVPMADWQTVGPEGRLLTFTVVRRQLAAMRKKVPVIVGLILLDRADTAMLHHIEAAAPDQVRIGMRLKAEFAARRSGSISEIVCFRPVE